MTDRGRRARFVEEPHHDVLLLRQLRQENLDRRRPTEQRMLCRVHGPHATSANPASHAILPDRDGGVFHLDSIVQQ
jgi:hypothetical protein